MPEICFVCNKRAFEFCQNLTKIKSSSSGLTISDLVKNLLQDFTAQRNVDDETNCICMECLKEIQVYDKMCVRLRNTLVTSERLQTQDTGKRAAGQGVRIDLKEEPHGTEIDVSTDDERTSSDGDVGGNGDSDWPKTNKTKKKERQTEFSGFSPPVDCPNVTATRDTISRVFGNFISTPAPTIKTENQTVAQPTVRPVLRKMVTKLGKQTAPQSITSERKTNSTTSVRKTVEPVVSQTVQQQPNLTGQMAFFPKKCNICKDPTKYEKDDYKVHFHSIQNISVMCFVFFLTKIEFFLLIRNICANISTSASHAMWTSKMDQNSG